MARALTYEIDKVKKKILFLGGLVEQNLRLALKAFFEKDARLAERIRNSDKEVDDAEIDVEEECLRILALHQPMASDLRFLITVLKINGDLERIGDLVAKIGKKMLRLSAPDQIQFSFSLTTMPLVAPMFEKAIWMLQSSLDSFVNKDGDLAYKVIITDDDLDMAKHEIRKELESLQPLDQEQRKAIDALLSITSNIERIADHTTNIAEDVVFMLQGTIIRHDENT